MGMMRVPKRPGAQFFGGQMPGGIAPQNAPPPQSMAPPMRGLMGEKFQKPKANWADKLAVFGGMLTDLSQGGGTQNTQAAADKWQAYVQGEQAKWEEQQKQKQDEYIRQLLGGAVSDPRQAALLQAGAPGASEALTKQAFAGPPDPLILSDGAEAYDPVTKELIAGNAKTEAPSEKWSPIDPPNGMGGYWERSDTTGQTRRVAAPPSNGVTIGADGSVQVGGPAGGNMPSKKTLTPLQLKMDEKYADTLAEWNTGGGPDVIKNLTQITDVAKVLESGEGNYTGALLGLTPDWVLAGINPDAINQRELVEEVVQRNLRVTLGAQFTAKEGDNLIKRAYNRNLPEAMNAARLRRLAQLIEGRAQQLQSLNQYMLQNGTSAGWDGSLMTADQMLSDLDTVSGGANSPGKGQKRRRWNSETQEFEVVQ